MFCLTSWLDPSGSSQVPLPQALSAHNFSLSIVIRWSLEGHARRVCVLLKWPQSPPGLHPWQYTRLQHLHVLSRMSCGSSSHPAPSCSHIPLVLSPNGIECSVCTLLVLPLDKGCLLRLTGRGESPAPSSKTWDSRVCHQGASFSFSFLTHLC